jgi:hypothetical protein
MMHYHRRNYKKPINLLDPSWLFSPKHDYPILARPLYVRLAVWMGPKYRMSGSHLERFVPIEIYGPDEMEEPACDYCMRCIVSREGKRQVLSLCRANAQSYAKNSGRINFVD